MESKLYRNWNHRNGVFSIFKEKRTDPLFHDVNLLVENIEIPTNKMLLAASSPYFLTMFTSLFRESKEKNVPINGISVAILRSIIDYVYSSEILITIDNVKDLLAASHLLQFNGISNECMQFLKLQIKPTNCLGIQAIADFYNYHDLVTDIKSYINKNFKAVTESEEFLLLSLNEVCSLISWDELRVSTEDVLGAMIVWIEYDIESRKQHFLLLLKNICFCYLSEQYVRQVLLNHHLFRDNPESYAYAKAAADRFFPIVEKPVHSPDKHGRYENLILLVAGGMESSNTVEYYCFKEQAWSELVNMPINCWGGGATVLNGKVYIVGGYLQNRVDIYDVAADRWIPGNGMQFRRQFCGVATLKNCIYAVGGFGDEEHLNTVEKYDPETKQWNAVAPMLTKRDEPGVGVIDDILYAVGGSNSLGCYLNLVESYNPTTNTWTYVNSMNFKRGSAGVGVLNGMLYAVGGYDGRLCLKSAEVFNPKTGNWTMIKDMHYCRRNAVVVATNDLLYVVGGAGEPNSYTSVEVYDPKTMNWTVLPSCMNIGRHCHWAAILEKSS